MRVTIPMIFGLMLLLSLSVVTSSRANLCPALPGECIPLFNSATRAVLGNCPHNNPPGVPGGGCSWDICYLTRNLGPAPTPANANAYCGAGAPYGLQQGYYSTSYVYYDSDGTMDLDYRLILPPGPPPSSCQYHNPKTMILVK